MNTWPATLPAPGWDMEEEYYKPQTKTEFEANYAQVFPRATRGRGKWALVWGLLSETDYQTLQAFFAANQGCMFTWTHPIAATTHTCVFTADSIKSKWYSAGWRANVQCPIEEV